MEYSNGVCEIQAILVYPIKLLLFNVYRPPDASLAKFKDVLNQVHKTLEKLQDDDFNIFITGDFNFPPEVVIWIKSDDVTIPVFKPSVSQVSLAFKELIALTDALFLLQVINIPTRKENTLDLCFTNDPQSINSIVGIPVSQDISDHKIIKINTEYTANEIPYCNPNIDSDNISNYNFEKANKVTLSNVLGSIVWDDIMPNNVNLVELKDIFIQHIVKAAITSGVPKFNCNSRQNKIPLNRKRLFRKRCKVLKSLEKSPLDTNLLTKINDINNDIQESYRVQRIRDEEKVVQDIRTDSQVC